MSLFRREAIKSSVCKPYKEMSIKARITRNNKWLLEMPSRDSRSCFANIIRKKNRVLSRIYYTVSNLKRGWMASVFVCKYCIFSTKEI